MATRGIIARKTGTSISSITGVYHHWDSYPDGLGQAIYDLYHGHFKDIHAMMRVLIDEHPAGWSTVIGCDFSQEPGFIDEAGILTEAQRKRPQCYCHGHRHNWGASPQRNADYTCGQSCTSLALAIHVRGDVVTVGAPS